MDEDDNGKFRLQRIKSVCCNIPRNSHIIITMPLLILISIILCAVLNEVFIMLDIITYQFDELFLIILFTGIVINNNPCRAGTKLRRQNLTSTDVRF